MTVKNDLGTQAVRKIHRLWNVDEEWTLWDERGFSWWAQDYRQRVWAELVLVDGGLSIYKLCARTDFARDINVQLPHFYEKFALLGKFASTSAPVIDASHKTVHFWTIMYLHQDIADWVTPFFAGLAIVQPIEAQIRAVEYARMIFGGQADTSAHPTSGLRRQGDDMLRTVELLYSPAGQEPSCWKGSGEFEGWPRR